MFIYIVTVLLLLLLLLSVRLMTFQSFLCSSLAFWNVVTYGQPLLQMMNSIGQLLRSLSMVTGKESNLAVIVRANKFEEIFSNFEAVFRENDILFKVLSIITCNLFPSRKVVSFFSDSQESIDIGVSRKK